MLWKEKLMRKFLLALVIMGFAAATLSAQADYSARMRQQSLTVGASASAFRPGNMPLVDRSGNLIEGGWPLVFGYGGFVDMRFSHWVQLEAEGRWMPFSTTEDIDGMTKLREINALIGPRVPIRKFGQYQLFGKGLYEWSKARSPSGVGHSCWASDDTAPDATAICKAGLALGATVEHPLNKLSRRLSWRGDFEYQLWLDNYGVSKTQSPIFRPYGLSLGLGYKIF